MGRIFALALVVVLGFAQANVSAQTPWESITSKEGQVTIELPGKPSTNRGSARRLAAT
jgi:hypothetical protein